MALDQLIRRPVETLAPDSTCEEAARLMRDQEIGCVVVEDEGFPVGIVTDRDLVTRLLAEGVGPGKTPLSEVMSVDPIFLTEDRSVSKALETMANFSIRRLIVVDSDGALEGLVSLDDLLPLLASHFDALPRVVQGSTGRGQ